LGDPIGASDYYGKVVALAREIAAADSSNHQAQYDLGHALSRYAILQGQPAERTRSLALLREAEGVFEKVLAADPNSTSAVRGLALAEEYAGNRLLDLGKPQEALVEYRRSLAIAERADLASQAITDERAIAQQLARQGGASAAREMAKRALAEAERFARSSPEGVRAKNNFAMAYSAVGSVEEILGDCHAARAAATRAISEWQQLAASGSMYIDKAARDRAEATLEHCGPAAR
jgi:tetratricopeptide (TPR) repeat protein